MSDNQQNAFVKEYFAKTWDYLINGLLHDYF
jgi:hypothetical protein